jgi:hypothetical protein
MAILKIMAIMLLLYMAIMNKAFWFKIVGENIGAIKEDLFYHMILRLTRLEV